MVCPHACVHLVVIESDATEDDHHLITLVQVHSCDQTWGILNETSRSPHIVLTRKGIAEAGWAAAGCVDVEGVVTEQIDRGQALVVGSSTDIRWGWAANFCGYELRVA